MSYNYEAGLIDRAVAMFATEVAGHTMTVLHKDGLYRHVQFRNPKTSIGWFELVTWPGRLTITGDCDAYTFTRLPDMFEFFRDSGRCGHHGINPHYWAEKLDANPRQARRYDPDMFHRLVREHVADAVLTGRTPRGITRAVLELLDDVRFDGYDQDETLARQELDRFSFNGWRFRDVWEWDCTSWDWHFLRACHAIAWGIARYDHPRPTDTVLTAPAPAGAATVDGARL